MTSTTHTRKNVMCVCVSVNVRVSVRASVRSRCASRFLQGAAGQISLECDY